MHLSDREAVAAISLMAMYADEHVAAEEDATLRERLCQFPLFEDMPDSELGGILAQIEQHIRKSGRDAVLADAIRAIQPWLRPTAFLVAAEVVAADGNVALAEHAFLQRLRKEFQLPDDTASRIFEVTTLRLKRAP